MSFQMGMKPNTGAFQDLETIIRRIARPTSQNLDRIEKSVRFGFASNFARQATADVGPWAPLAPRTQRERTFAGFNPSRPILVRTGAYMRSWTIRGYREIEQRADGWTMYVSGDSPNLQALELGAPGRNLPPRAVRYLDSGSQRNVLNALDDLVDRVLRTL